jgi:hypothetical protein
MSFNHDRIGHESGEWFERYVQDIFRFAGFKTERDRVFVQSVKHEIDVWAESEFAAIAAECKDWSWLPPNNIKKEFDAFIAKVQQIGATAGVFAVNLPDRAILQRYRDYLRQNRLTLWNSAEVEKWHEDIERYDKLDYQKRLCDAIGIVIRQPTNTEKTFKILRTFGKAAFKTAKTVAENLAEDERPQRRKKRSRSRHR